MFRRIGITRPIFPEDVKFASTIKVFKFVYRDTADDYDYFDEEKSLDFAIGFASEKIHVSLQELTIFESDISKLIAQLADSQLKINLSQEGEYERVKMEFSDGIQKVEAYGISPGCSTDENDLAYDSFPILGMIMDLETILLNIEGGKYRDFIYGLDPDCLLPVQLPSMRDRWVSRYLGLEGLNLSHWDPRTVARVVEEVNGDRDGEYGRFENAKEFWNAFVKDEQRLMRSLGGDWYQFCDITGMISRDKVANEHIEENNF